MVLHIEWKRYIYYLDFFFFSQNPCLNQGDVLISLAAVHIIIPSKSKWNTTKRSFLGIRTLFQYLCCRSFFMLSTYHHAKFFLISQRIRHKNYLQSCTNSDSKAKFLLGVWNTFFGISSVTIIFQMRTFLDNCMCSLSACLPLT